MPQNTPPSDASGLLAIDLSAVQANYNIMRQLAPKAQCAAVVKADAYGTGVTQIAPALHKAGCRTFFVATIPESLALRTLLPDVQIFCLNGLLPDTAELLATHHIRPVLGGLEEIAQWTAFCQKQQRPFPAALHFDTGMNRLGLTEDETRTLLADQSWRQDWQPALVMSHLACADTPDHPLNTRQRKAFERIAWQFPGIPASLANSAGVLLGPDWHFDLVRPGIFLYGSWPVEKSLPSIQSPLQHKALHLQQTVATLTTRILKIKTVPAGQSIGYGARFTLETPARIATLSIGYADGYLRTSGQQQQARVWLSGQKCPVVGRVSMDLITIDVSQIKETDLWRGAPVEIIGPHNNVDDVAAAAGTIGYEILTSLGGRYVRTYLPSDTTN